MTSVEEHEKRHREIDWWFRRLVETGFTSLPRPGAGHTPRRLEALRRLCHADPDVGRLVEAHCDADAILHEVTGRGVGPAERWAVWAARVPGVPLEASPRGESLVLKGRKAWCSGASLCTHALLTADLGEEHRLLRVDLRHPGVTVGPDTWAHPGMKGTDTREVAFEDVPAELVGPASSYLNRPGFWHGAVGVASCWLGTAERTVHPLASRCARPGASDLDLAALGAVDAALAGARWALESAAREIDEEPDDLRAAHRRARRVRAVVEKAVVDVLAEVGSATGAAPLASDPAHVAAVADTSMYIRQSHGRRDLADLGRLVEGGTRAGLDRPSRQVADPGTPAAEWAAWLRSLDVPELPLPEGPVLVVSPHPDDETLGAGGLLARVAGAGGETVVVVVTDGAGSHPGSPTRSPGMLARARRAETGAATAVLGVRETVHLDFPDGGLSDRGPEVAAAIAEVASRQEARTGRPVVLVAPWSGDRHPDHEAVGRACARVADEGGRQLLEYLLWTWHWADPGAADVPWHRLARLDVAEVAGRKRAAVAEYRTQIAPLSDDPRDAAILPSHVLARLCTDSEWYLR